VALLCLEAMSAAKALAVPPGLPQTEPEKLHLLPCAIKANCTARVSSFFLPRERRGQHIAAASAAAATTKVLQAEFRGRELLGAVVDVPEGFVGLIARKEEDAEEGKVVATAKFRQFTRWSLEQEPSDEDPVARWLVWPAIARAVRALSYPLFLLCLRSLGCGATMCASTVAHRARQEVWNAARGCVQAQACYRACGIGSGGGSGGRKRARCCQRATSKQEAKTNRIVF